MKHQLRHSAILFAIVVITLLNAQYIQAATPSPASATDSATTETTDELKKRIERAVEEKREQIKGALQGIAADKKGFIGEIQRVTDEAITVKSIDKTTIIPVTDSIELRRNNVAIKTSDIAVGNWAIVTGKESSTGDFIPERVTISIESLEPAPQIIMLGSIETITTKDITVKSRLNDQSQTFLITKDSDVENNDGTAIQIRLFQKEMQALFVGVETDKGIELKTVRALAPVKR